MAVSAPAPPRFLAWKQAGPAASSAVLSSKCLLTWVRRCLQVGTGPGDESSEAGAMNAVLGADRAKQSCWQITVSLQESWGGIHGIPPRRGSPQGPAVFWGGKVRQWKSKVRKPKT